MNTRTKSVQESHTIMTQIVFPEHANALGKAFGGQIMAWADMAGGICSMRHSEGLTVTASVDDMVFERPIAIGEVVTVSARVNATFGSSMEVEVLVDAEKASGTDRRRCLQARFTFVAIDADGKLRAVIPLTIATEEDQQRVNEALVRRQERLARRKK